MKMTHNSVLEVLSVVMLLFELLELLQGEKRSASLPDRFLWVSHGPLLKCLRVATLHV